MDEVVGVTSWRGDVVVVRKKGAPNVVSRRKRSCGVAWKIRAATELPTWSEMDLVSGKVSRRAATELPTWSEMDLVSGKVSRRSESGREMEDASIQCRARRWRRCRRS
jgi:hypothetical protein